MRSPLSKTLLSYVVSVFLLVFLTGCLLSQIVDDYIFLISILIIEFIVMIVILLHIFEKYIKPIQVATKTITKLVDGNYWSRFHYKSNGMSADRKSTRLNSSHVAISYAVFCLNKKKVTSTTQRPSLP